MWDQEPLKHHPMVVQGNFVPGGHGDVLQQKLSPSGAPLSPPCAWDSSKFMVLHRMSHVARVPPASVCGPANGHMLSQTDCGEAPGVVAQCGGSAVGGTGLPPLSGLACGCVSAWLGFQLVPAGSETRAAPKMGCASGYRSDGNRQESGFLRPESCRVAASEEAPAESPLLTLGWAQGYAPTGQAGGHWRGQGPHTAPGWDLAASRFPHSTGTPESAPLSTGVGPE